MIEHGNLIFSGTLDEFHDSVKSNTCIVKLENAPAEGELGNIPGVIKVKKLDEHSFRLQLEQEGEEVAKRVAEICVNRGWRLSEMQMERYPWMRFLLSYRENEWLINFNVTGYENNI